MNINSPGKYVSNHQLDHLIKDVQETNDFKV